MKKSRLRAARAPNTISGAHIALFGGQKMDVIVDTLAFRARGMSLSEFFNFLGLKEFDTPWTASGNYNMNYLSSLRYNGIIIGYDGQKGWDLYFYASGKGCRTYEDLRGEDFKWEFLISKLGTLIKDDMCAITRIDIAVDSFDETLNLQRIEKYVSSHKILSKCPMSSIRLVKFGEECFYCGSKNSQSLLRIYNKKLERGYDREDDSIPYWYRCEFQLRDSHAQQIILEWSNFICGKSTVDIGHIFAGHVLQHVKFLTKPNKHDGCQHRIPVASWWRNFLENCESIKWASVKGSEYNLSRLERYAIGNAGSSIKTMIKSQNLDPDALFSIYMNSDKIKLRPDQLEFIRKCQSEVLKNEGI